MISLQLFQCVQDTFAGRKKPKYRKHDLAFAGLLACAHDGCTVGKYVYCRCSDGRGKCLLPFMREEYVSEQLGKLKANLRYRKRLLEQSRIRCMLTWIGPSRARSRLLD